LFFTTRHADAVLLSHSVKLATPSDDPFAFFSSRVPLAADLGVHPTECKAEELRPLDPP